MSPPDSIDGMDIFNYNDCKEYCKNNPYTNVLLLFKVDTNRSTSIKNNIIMNIRKVRFRLSYIYAHDANIVEVRYGNKNLIYRFNHITNDIYSSQYMFVSNGDDISIIVEFRKYIPYNIYLYSIVNHTFFE